MKRRETGKKVKAGNIFIFVISILMGLTVLADLSQSSGGLNPYINHGGNVGEQNLREDQITLSKIATEWVLGPHIAEENYSTVLIAN